MHKPARPHPVGLSFRLVAILLFIVIPLSAYADPGSGVLIWQVMGAFFLGIVYQVRKFFGRNREK